MTRRGALGLTGLALSPVLAAKNRIGRSRLSAITDEIARTPEDAIAFARQYGLRWLELRNVPGTRREYAALPEEDLKQAAGEFAAAGIRISFLNTGMLKFPLPGTEQDLVRKRQGSEEELTRWRAQIQTEFDRRGERLRAAIRAAQVLDTDKVRVFTFHRVSDPSRVMPKVIEILEEYARVASAEGMSLLIENEGSCNVATCAELAALMVKLPSKAIAINWDPLNGRALQEIPFPDGYQRLPKKRIANVQVKGRSILDYPEKLDWATILRALEKDGYRGQVGLETHISGERLIEHSHQSIRAMLGLVEPS